MKSIHGLQSKECVCAIKFMDEYNKFAYNCIKHVENGRTNERVKKKSCKKMYANILIAIKIDNSQSGVCCVEAYERIRVE